jgi:hypothetical protein
MAVFLYNIRVMSQEQQSDIIEAEVVDERLDAPKKDAKPHKPIHEYSRQIRFWNLMAEMFTRYGPSLLILGALAGLAFSILASQTGYQGFFFVCMIIGWSLCGAGVLATIFAFIARAVLHRYMSLDSNLSGD